MVKFLAMNFDLATENTMYSKEMTIILTAIVALFVLFPLATNNEMGGFRYFSILAILCIMYVLLILLIELPAYARYNFSYERLKLYEFSWDTFSYFAITAFAFSCHMEYVQIVDELNDQSEKRLRKVIFRSVSVNTILYTVVALLGYFSTYEKTSQIVIERKAIPTLSTDLSMIIARIMIIIVLCIAFPMNMVPMKKIIVQSIYGKRHLLTTG